MMNVVKKLVPSSIKRSLKGYLERRYKERLFGELAPLIPAIAEMFDGPASLEAFKANGEEFLQIYKKFCGVRPDEKMLDVGCGIGRKTWPLTQLFTKLATYEGIDITKTGIQWCAENITPRYPNFRFQQIDVYNNHYNPKGKYRPSTYKFPFENGAFTFVTLGSVFTHMLPDDLTNYLLEVYRVLDRGGRCLITYFLLNNESLGLIRNGKSTIDFHHDSGIYRLVSNETPELAIAFDESWVKELYQKIGFKVTCVEYGSWCARPEYMSYQDLILAVKE